MIRSCAILLLVLTTAMATIPSSASYHSVQSGNFASHVPPNYDPSGTPTAFNYTYSQANLYTNTSANAPQQFPSSFPANNLTGRQITWFSTVNRTIDNTPIANTGFRFNLTKSNLVQGKLVYNWTLVVPKFNCGGCSSVYVEFNLFGKITSGTNASYLLSPLSPPNSTRIAFQSYTTVGAFNGGPSLGCPENVCLNVTRWVGYTVTLTFSFGWITSPSTGMSVDVGEISVTSIGNFHQSTTNLMQQDNSNPNSILHTATMSPIGYNNNLTTFVQPGNVSTLQRWWRIEAISIYYPVGYTSLQISMNSTDTTVPTQMSPAPPSPTAFSKAVPLETESCVNQPVCSESLIALNVSDFHISAHNSTITIISKSPNSMSSLTTLSAGASAQVFAPGDTLGVKVVNKPAIVNASSGQKSGSLNILFIDHSGKPHTLGGSQTFPVLTITGGVYNVTLPSDCSLCGTWAISANFTSGFDLGLMSTAFQIDQIQVTAGTFLVSGDNRGLNIQGSLTNSTGATVPTAVGLVFAVDEGTPASLPTTTTNSSSGTGLYISNVTMINAVFTQGQSLIMTFTIVNPSSTSYNASVRIEHEWPGSPTLAHGMFANFTIGSGDGLGDLPIIFGPLTYQAAFTLTSSGVGLSLTSLKTGNSEPIAVSLGTSPVSFTESHAGLFKVTVTSKSGSSTIGTNSLTSPPYAYVVGLPFSPTGFLAASQTFAGTSFTVKIVSDAILGAKKLVVFALARDSDGRILANNSLNPGFSDSTVLAATMDSVGQVTKGQTATATIHLTSNATKITQIITVNLNLQGSTVPLATQSNVTISPGATQSITLTFVAPSNTGQYTITFSSPQYNGNVALASQTLQVTIVQSNLQILIPAAIGVVAAIIVLGIYLVKRQPEAEVENTKTKPSDQKTRPAPKNPPPSKSLTRT